MARALTQKQLKFIENIISGLSQSESYRQAGYKASGTTETIAKEAHRLAVAPHIAPLIAQRRQEMANKAVWGREEALKMLAEIAKGAKEYMIVEKTFKRLDESGEELEITQKFFDPATANSATKAIEQANKMCGYNEPDKVDIQSNGFEVIITNATDKNRA